MKQFILKIKNLVKLLNPFIKWGIKQFKEFRAMLKEAKADSKRNKKI